MKMKQRFMALIATAAIAFSALTISTHIPSVPPAADDFGTTCITQRVAPQIALHGDALAEDDDSGDCDRSWKRRLRKAAKWMARNGVSLLFRLLVLLPLTLLARLVLWLIGNFLGGLLLFFKLFLGELLFGALALFVVMTALYHALHPQDKLQKYWRLRTLLHILCTSAALAAVRSGLSLFAAPASLALLLPRTATLFLAIVWLWHKTLLPEGAFGARLVKLLLRLESILLLAAYGGGLWCFLQLTEVLARSGHTSGALASLGMGTFYYMALAAAAVYVYRYDRHILLTKQPAFSVLQPGVSVDKLPATGNALIPPAEIPPSCSPAASSPASTAAVVCGAVVLDAQPTRS